MTLWNELGGRSWSARAGPRSAAAEPRRRTGRRRQLARSRRAYPRHRGGRARDRRGSGRARRASPLIREGLWVQRGSSPDEWNCVFVPTGDLYRLFNRKRG
jgi:hypothetical protein